MQETHRRCKGKVSIFPGENSRQNFPSIVCFIYPLIQESGASCAKLQKKDCKGCFTKKMLAKPYNTPNSWGPTYEAHKKYLEFDEHQMKELMEYADSVGIALMSTPMDIVSSHVGSNLGSNLQYLLRWFICFSSRQPISFTAWTCLSSRLGLWTPTISSFWSTWKPLVGQWWSPQVLHHLHLICRFLTAHQFMIWFIRKINDEWNYINEMILMKWY